MLTRVLVPTTLAVLAAVNSGKYSQRVAAVRSYAQWQHKFEIAESEGLRLDVVPVSRMETDLGDRGSIDWSPRTDIVLRKKFGQGDLSETDGRPKNSSVDPLVGLLEEIYAFLVAKRLNEHPDAVWEEEELLASYMPSHLREKHQYTGVIRVTHAVNTELPI